MSHESSLSTGFQGEEYVCRYLVEQGYRILDRNWRCREQSRYELDIIAQDGDTIVFCEVKTAKTKKFGSPVSWVTEQKARRIACAAIEYIAANTIQRMPFRFDVIGLEVEGGTRSITHIRNAFSAPEDR